MNDDTTAAPSVATKRYAHKEFQLLHRELRRLHPGDWAIEWERLPHSLETDDEGQPIYLKASRSGSPHTVLMHKDGRLVASLERSGYWQTWRYGLAGQLVGYENSLGAWFKQYWCFPLDEHPAERHTGANRWVFVASQGQEALYWCALTGMFMANGVEYERENLHVYFSNTMGRWGARELADVIHQQALALPSSTLGRWWWRKTSHNPA